MGNDGGSIPDRRDLVRNKPKAEQADKANQTRAKWFFCALSKRKLQEPVVSCALGKLYNKDAMIEFLLDRSIFGDGEKICGHIRSLKDIKTLKLTINSALLGLNTSVEPTDRAQFVCALTMKEMNGVQPFIYISTCGCVFSQAGLKTLISSKDKGKDKESSGSPLDSPEGVVELCPNCATKYSKDDAIPLNPSPEEEEGLRLNMERRRTQELSKKKSKKRKNDTPTEGEPAKKRHEAMIPIINAGAVTATSRAVASELEMGELKRKANMSSAVKSLYENRTTRKETFMTRGTFTRYA